MAKIIIIFIMLAVVLYINSPTYQEKGFKEQARNHLKTLNSLSDVDRLTDGIKETEREKVDNQYPIINIEYTLLTVNKSSLEVADVNKLTKRIFEFCDAFFSPTASQRTEKSFKRAVIAYAKVAQENNITFKLTIKDKMGKVITTAEQKITKRPNFKAAMAGEIL